MNSNETKTLSNDYLDKISNRRKQKVFVRALVVLHISKINIRNLSKEIAYRNLSKELRSTRNLSKEPQSFERFRYIFLSKYFRIYCEILRNNAKYIAQYCENRPNKTMQTLSNYLISGVAGGNICILSRKSAVFHKISQYFAFFKNF